MARSKKSLLWRIQHPESVRLSYIYGTMHVKDNKAFNVIDLALEHMSQCNLMACEFNLDEARGRGMGNVMQLPDQLKLEDIVATRKYLRWKNICQRAFSINLDSIQRLLPMTIVSLLSECLLQKDKAVSVDQYLWEQATEMGLTLDGVESLQDQKSIMTQIELDYQIKLLKDLFRNVNSFKRQLDALIKLYQNQEIHKLYKKSKKSLGKYKHLLLYERNQNMADRINELTVDNNAFIAIGAAHLSGKKGVLHLLKEKGMILKPIFE